MVSSSGVDAEVKFATSSGEVAIVLSNDLSIPHAESTSTEINWSSEAVLLIHGRRNNDTIIVTNVSGCSSTDFSVGNFDHIFDNLLTVALLLGASLVVKSLYELVLILDSVLVESNSLGIDDSIEEWEWLDVVSSLGLVIWIILEEIFLFNSLVPDSEVSNNFSSVLGLFISGLLFLNSDVDAVSLEIFVSKASSVTSVSGLHSGKDTWLGLGVH
jgi:hypothetical protein